MLGYKTKYLWSELVKFRRNPLMEYKDQKHVIPIRANLTKSINLVKDKIKADIFKGKRQYPNKQKI